MFGSAPFAHVALTIANRSDRCIKVGKATSLLERIAIGHVAN